MIGALQENLICLLCYDEEHAPIIRGVVDPSLFGGIYRVLVTRIYDYLDRYKKPPGDHLPDLLSDKLDGQGREAGLYAETIQQIYDSHKGINTEYVMARLEQFVRGQSLRSVAIDLAKALQRDTEESLEEAEMLIAGAKHKSLSVFDPGTRLNDKKAALKFLDSNVAAFPTGIPELDKRGFGPTRKELNLYVADTKRGKTWWLIQLAKLSLMQRLKVLHITLEMSEDRCAQRYFMALFAMAKRDEVLPAVKFERNDLGKISGFNDVRLQPQLNLDDPRIRDKLEKKIDKWGSRLLQNIIIKQFPGSQLTMPMLIAYMDNLEASEQFVPDLVLLDYPDLMKHDIANYRLSIDNTFKEFRGLMVARNMAGAAVSQSNKEGAKSKTVMGTHAGEAYTKIAHCDTSITYSQTTQEQKLGLARLTVVAGRNDADKITIVISQQYGLGAYVIDSNLMVGNYWESLPQEES